MVRPRLPPRPHRRRPPPPPGRPRQAPRPPPRPRDPDPPGARPPPTPHARPAHPAPGDLRDTLARPAHALAGALGRTHDELRLRCRPMLDACATLLDHQYAGMFDGPTNIDLDWDTSPGVVLNLSAVLDQAIPLE